MIARDKLKELIDELPEGELVTAERFLEYLRDRPSSGPATRAETVELELAEREGRPYRVLSPRFANPADAEHFNRDVTYLDRPVEELPDDAI